MPKLFLPSLLDRLRDDQPGLSQESSESRGTTLAEYRELVIRDMSMLMNHPSIFATRVGSGPGALAESTEELQERFPLQWESVLNYGLDLPLGSAVSDDLLDDLCERLKWSLECFEPRIRNVTVSEQSGDPESGEGKASVAVRGISFVVDAELVAEPYPESLRLRTELDLVSGRCEMQD